MPDIFINDKVESNTPGQEAITAITSNQNPPIKRLVIIVIICLLLTGAVIAALGYFKIVNRSKPPSSTQQLPPQPKNSIALVINNQPISQKAYDDRLSYLESVRDIKDLKLAKKITSQSFIENFVLVQAAKRNNIEITENEVSQYLKASSVSASLANSPDFKNDVKNTLIRKKLESLIIASRSGKYIIVGFGFDVGELTGVDQKELALTKITEARNKIVKGVNFESVGKQLDQDVKVRLLNKGSSTFDFNLKPKEDTLYSKEFEDAIFEVKQAGGLTEIITLQNDPLKWHRKPDQTEFGFAFAKIDSITPGKASSYEDWLKEQSKLSTIKDNVNYEF